MLFYLMLAARPFLLLACPQALSYRPTTDVETYATFFAAYRQTVEAPLQQALVTPLQPYLYFKEWLIYDLQTTEVLASIPQALLQSRQALRQQEEYFQQTFGIQPQLQAALDVGEALPMENFHHSIIPERLPRFLPVAEHYQCWLVVGEYAQSYLDTPSLDYLTRSYFDGQALELWGQF